MISEEERFLKKIENTRHHRKANKFKFPFFILEPFLSQNMMEKACHRQRNHFECMQPTLTILISKLYKGIQ